MRAERKEIERERDERNRKSTGAKGRGRRENTHVKMTVVRHRHQLYNNSGPVLLLRKRYEGEHSDRRRRSGSGGWKFTIREQAAITDRLCVGVEEMRIRVDDDGVPRHEWKSYVFHNFLT